MEAEGRDHRTNPEDAVPKPKDQRNLTDPESKIMKTSNKGFDQCGNAQAVANEQQIIIAANVTNQTNDVRQAIPLIEQTIENPDAAGVTENIAALTADRVTSAKTTWSLWTRTITLTMCLSRPVVRSTAIRFRQLQRVARPPT